MSEQPIPFPLPFDQIPVNLTHLRDDLVLPRPSRKSVEKKGKKLKYVREGGGGKNTLLTSLPSSAFSDERLRTGKGGERTRALSPFSLPSKRKVSCVIKQRGRNVSSVQERPYCPHREAARVDGGDGGIAAPRESKRVGLLPEKMEG